jgi:amino acid adenylation domain-containing protein
MIKSFKAFETSSAQKRIFLEHHLHGRTTLYNMPLARIAEGNLDIGRLQAAFSQLSSRHESLRTAFILKDEEILQLVYDKITVDIPCQDIPHAGIHQIIDGFIKPFDLDSPPLWRVELIKLDKDKHLLFFDIHHIIADGVSLSIILRELAALYQGIQLPPLEFQYVDFTLWQNDLFAGEEIKKQEQYWLDLYKSDIPRLSLPTDFPKAKGIENSGANIYSRMEPHLAAGVEELARSHKVTLNMIFLSAYFILLWKYTGQEDIVVGIPVAGRSSAEMQKLVGMFVNTLAFRCGVFPGMNFSFFLEYFSTAVAAAFENQDYPFEKLIEKLNPRQQGIPSGLPQTLFIFDYLDDSDWKQGLAETPTGEKELRLTPYPIDSKTAKADILLTVSQGPDSFLLDIEYATGLFCPGTIKRLVNHYMMLLEDILQHPTRLLSELNMISSDERHQLLYKFNDSSVDYPADKTLVELFDEQVKKTPHHMAVIGLDFVSLTYRQLSQKSNQLAHLLKGKGVQPDSIVGIMVQPSIEMVIGLIGILKARGAYLPIDPDYPPERVSYILADSRVKILVSEGSQGSWACQLIDINNLGEKAKNAPPHPGGHSPMPLGYLIYTSGSTGRPKGVMVNQASVVNLLTDLQQRYPLLQSDAYLLRTSFAFDVSVSELLGWYWGGGRLIILGKQDRKDPWKTMDVIASYGITHINFVPTLFDAFIEALTPQNIDKLTSLKYIFLAGETLLPELVEQFRRLNTHITLENLYGPTEGTIYASGYSLVEWQGSGPIPIGKPLQNITLYILDNYSHLQPIGVSGQLYIGGHGLARGYLNNPGLTAEKFIEIYFNRPNKSNRTYIKLYKTGDLARWREDGNIEFLGRIDQQVKIRGFRIELGEIESQMLSHEKIKDAVVVTRTDKKGDKFLCAYVVIAQQVSIPGLREFLSGKLPDYMIPANFILLERIPLTPSGKIDRLALPEPDVPRITWNYAAPTDPLQEKLVEIWSQVFCPGRDTLPELQIGIDDNFFALGGHSLKAMVIIARINKEFNKKILLAELFKRPTIRGLSEILRGKRGLKQVSVKPVEKMEYYGLSSIQKRLYILQQMYLESSFYNLSQLALVDGNLEVEKLRRAFCQLIHRHESLRTSFFMTANEPVQRVHDEVKFELENYEIKVEAEVKVEENVMHFIRPFDLSQAPLLRVGLVKLLHSPPALNRYLLVVDMHHIITDGTSMQLLIKEFMAGYAGKELPVLKFQYRDYSRWQNSDEHKEVLKRQQEYWVKQFAGEIPVLDLPYDYPRPVVYDFEGEAVKFELSSRETQELRALALAEGATLFIVLLAVTTTWLSKLSHQQEIVLGIPITSRCSVDLLYIIGMFVNTLAIKNYPAGDKTFRIFLKEVKERTLQAFENQEYSFEELVEQVSVNRDVSRNPLFDVFLVLQNMETQANEIPGVEIPDFKITPYERESKTSKFDITLGSVETGGKLLFTLEYCVKLFKKDTIKRLVSYFKRIAATAPQDVDLKIAEIDIIPPEEKRQLIVDFNDTETLYPQEKPLPQLLAEQVEQTPDHIALVGWSDRSALSDLSDQSDLSYISITYRELNDRTDRLAYLLRDKGIRADTIVGIMVERSVEMIIGLMGILNAEGAYLPIDTQYPEERINYMLADSGAKMLITTNPLVKKVKKVRRWEGEKNFEILFLDSTPLLTSDLPNFLTSQPPDFPLLPATGNRQPATSLAYAIYTSGSTGKPKGVMINHGSVINFITAITRHLPCWQGETVLSLTTITFDIFGLEIFIPLSSGGRVIIGSQQEQLEPTAAVLLMEREQVTLLQVTPSRLSLLLEGDTGQRMKLLKYLLVGGEAFPPQLLEKASALPNMHLYNLYGPTETTIWSTLKELTPGGPITIGTPLANTRIYITDLSSKLQPLGVPGELCIGGAGLARGYLNNPELTAEKFCLGPGALFEKTAGLARGYLNNPELTAEKFCLGPGALFEKTAPGHRKNFLLNQSPLTTHHSPIYKTGDLARWQPDGNIEFLGRLDHQVKIRGFRIELEEIEYQLLTYPTVNTSIVIARQDKTGAGYLCAYIVTNQETSISALREYLTGKLPAYMIPTYFVFLTEFPLTPSEKIDRRALPEPEPEVGEINAVFKDEVENTLAEIWSELLGVEKNRIGTNSNFFGLGGHSVKATMMGFMVQKRLGVTIPLVELFKTPFIKAIAQYIKTAIGAGESKTNPGVEDENLVLLRKGDRNGIHLFLVHAGSGEVAVYTELCNQLDPGINCWGLRADRLGKNAPRNVTIEGLAQQYIKKIKKVQNRGPYHLAGWCIGGTIAFEMVSQLEQAGENPQFFAMINSAPPDPDMLDKAIEFTPGFEASWASDFLVGQETREKLKDAADLQETWSIIFADLLENHVDPANLRKDIPENVAEATPNFQHQGIKGLIFYLNMFRSLENARNKYIPLRKNQTLIHFIGAKEYVINNRAEWNKYTHLPLEFYPVKGGHFSMYEAPYVISLARTFSSLINKSQNSLPLQVSEKV